LIPLHTASTIALGVVRNSKEMIGKPFTRILISNDTERTWWGNWEDDVYAIGDFLIPWLKQSKNRESYFKKHKDRFLGISASADKMLKFQLNGMKDNELLSAYESFHDDTMRYHALSFDIDAMDIVLEDKIKTKLKVLLKEKNGEFSQKKTNDALGIILRPSYTSYITELDINLQNIVLMIKKKSLKDFEKDEEVMKEIEKLVKRFWWTELSWSRRNIKTKEKVIGQIKEMIKKGDNPGKEIERIRGEAAEAEKKKKELRKDLSFDEEMDFYMEIFENYAVFHDYRKEAQMKTMETLNTILDEIGRRKGYRFDDLAWLWPDEIKGILKGKTLDSQKTKERRESFFAIVEERKNEEHTGRIAIKRRGDEISSAFEGLSNFTGTTASPGKVVGKVKVCFSSEDAIRKVEKGDILVASMTLPDYIPAMKRAAAIVTDEGGVTCHAAIMSREFKVPCIIGTGIATKVLKDGDIVEVNANHGIVNVIR
jgi:phosphohistidine swiveling domain-containing protein